MANGKTTTTARRREMRRSVPRPTSAWAAWLRSREALWAALFISVLGVLSAVVAAAARSEPDYAPGQVLLEPRVARIKFVAPDEDETRMQRRVARDSEPSVYRANTAYLNQVRDRLDELMRYAADPTVTGVDQLPPEVVQRYIVTNATLRELRRFLKDGEPAQPWKNMVDRYLYDGLATLAALRPARYEVERQSITPDRVRLMMPRPGQEEPVKKEYYDSALLSVQGNQQFMQDKLRQYAEVIFPGALAPSVIAITLHDPQPIYTFDKDTTDANRQRRFDEVRPVEKTYQVNELLVAAGEKLSGGNVELLDEERAAYQATLGAAEIWLPRAGMLGMLLLLAVGLWSYLLAYNPRIARNPMRGMAITALLLLCQAAAVALTQAAPQYLFVSATMPTLVVATVLAIVYDQRFALAVGALHTLMVMIALDQSIGFGVVALAGIGVAVSQLDEVRSRSKLLQVGGVTSAVMALAALCVGLFERPLNLPGQLTFVGFDVAMAAVSGIATGLLVQGVLPLIESVFKVTTAMTLKELNDASHPLLQRLAQEAAGTYAHSLRIADMAEAAADAIGSSGLLCRVGSMYHDIGKINKPSYFIENQAGGPNRHSKLSPAMSLLIIVGHVKDGIEMGREYGLPPVLRHFIESHHGTTLVEYFYHAARKQKEAEDAPAPAEFDYRYPGPKPQTKEAAIVLLCDTCESAVRALPDPTPIRIEQRVHELASKRLMDGQFDESNLTLAELSRIEASVVKTLNAMYHGRISYPGGPDQRGDRPRDAAPSSPLVSVQPNEDRAIAGKLPQHAAS